MKAIITVLGKDQVGIIAGVSSLLAKWNVNVLDISQTILQASINIICFLVSFLVLYIVLAIVLNLLKAVFRFPVLKQLNGLAGGAFGFLRGLLVCLVLFTLVPLVQTVIPLDMVNDLIAQSTLAPIFSNGNLILAIMNGKL